MTESAILTSGWCFCFLREHWLDLGIYIYYLEKYIREKVIYAMKERSEEKNNTCLELWIGIAFCGIIFTLAGLFFVADPVSYFVGVLVGAILAAFSVYHMEKTLIIALELPEKNATSYAITRNLLRYGVVVLVFFLLLYTGWGNPLAAFLGLMTMKVSAYLQPITHKAIQKFTIKRR